MTPQEFIAAVDRTVTGAQFTCIEVYALAHRWSLFGNVMVRPVFLMLCVRQAENGEMG